MDPDCCHSGIMLDFQVYDHLPCLTDMYAQRDPCAPISIALCPVSVSKSYVGKHSMMRTIICLKSQPWLSFTPVSHRIYSTISESRRKKKLELLSWGLCHGAPHHRYYERNLPRFSRVYLRTISTNFWSSTSRSGLLAHPQISWYKRGHFRLM